MTVRTCNLRAAIVLRHPRGGKDLECGARATACCGRATLSPAAYGRIPEKPCVRRDGTSLGEPIDQSHFPHCPLPKEAQMNGKQIALGIVLADFLALTAYAVWAYGYVGIFELLFANAATILGSTDLLISLSLVSIWVWQDAKKRGISPVPYLVVTAVLGSAGPLLYLIRTVGSEARHTTTGAMPARSLA